MLLASARAPISHLGKISVAYIFLMRNCLSFMSALKIGNNEYHSQRADFCECNCLSQSGPGELFKMSSMQRTTKTKPW